MLNVSDQIELAFVAVQSRRDAGIHLGGSRTRTIDHGSEEIA
jgi:hypothetical protein